MNDREDKSKEQSAASVADDLPDQALPNAARRRQERIASRRWWLKLAVQPALFLCCGVLFLVGLGMAQKLGWISAGKGDGGGHASIAKEDVQYICPMMCTPPQAEPGRCPVCAMELVPTATRSRDGDSRSVQFDPVARRIANIRTVAVRIAPAARTIRTIGELSFDEGTLKTISAYVDGRLDRLLADYTGVVVEKGDRLALVYSPRLYTSQVELLLANKARNDSQSATLDRVIQSNHDLHESAKQRLIELGMTEAQIREIENAGEANSRMHLVAPIRGTVIEKLAVEGQYVKEGQAIYKLADLTTVWLVLKLFPEDAADIRFGQKVSAEVQSLPGRQFTGRVAFVDPTVDPKTRTVGVRVVIPNQDGLLRVGDYAKATIDVPIASSSGRTAEIYDPDLADKWISPRHPHVIESSPGKCRICGVDLVPAVQFGFASEPTTGDHALVVPRDAVLMAGENSIVYVETEPGRFEIRRVVVGPSDGDQIVIQRGVKEGDRVATRGNFLIDSQMQLAGNPSLIDPTKGVPTEIESRAKKVLAALSRLSAHDRALAEKQRTCPVTDEPLGSMGTPPKVEVDGTSVFLCCIGCKDKLLETPEKYLAKIAAAADSNSSDTLRIPPIDVPEMFEAQDGLPPIETPQVIPVPESEGQPLDESAVDRSAGLPKEDDR